VDVANASAQVEAAGSGGVMFKSACRWENNIKRTDDFVIPAK